MFERNVHYRGPLAASPWRKIAVATWKSCGDPSVYGTLEFDATTMLAAIAEEKSRGNRLTPTIFIARCAALSLRRLPSLNSVLRWGRLYERASIDIFLQVSTSGEEDNLSGVLIRECDKKSFAEIGKELSEKSGHIKRGDDREFKKMKATLNRIPTFLIRPIINLLGFVQYTLNLWTPLFNSPRDGFGSAMVTSVGMLGIDNGFAPLVPYSRCPMLLSVGRIQDKPVVSDGKVVIRPMISIGVTLDHRQVDGKGAAFMLHAFREFIEKPH
jgi:pyruvate dehydrogenase E2 component (dihydrolipoamide acetyltransferase)